MPAIALLVKESLSWLITVATTPRNIEILEYNSAKFISTTTSPTSQKRQRANSPCPQKKVQQSAWFWIYSNYSAKFRGSVTLPVQKILSRVSTWPSPIPEHLRKRPYLLGFRFSMYILYPPVHYTPLVIILIQTFWKVQNITNLLK